jgi:hypothetical protein
MGAPDMHRWGKIFALVLAGASFAPLARAEAVPAKPADHAKHTKVAKKGMPTAHFHQVIEGRIARAKDKLEHHIEKQKLSAAKSAALRQTFNQGVVQVRAKMASVGRDGVVSRDEAREVQGLVQKLRAR